MRELPRETRHERGVRGCSAGIESCSRDRCSSQKGSVARKAAGATWAVCAESRLYSFSWKLLVKVTDTELATVDLHPHHFHGEWNYTIKHYN